MALATLSIDLIAKLASLEQDMGKAARISEQSAARIERALDGARATAAKVGAAIGAMFAADNVVRFVRAQADAMDALNDTADATGSTIEKLSGLEDVARRNGGTLDDVTGILVKFNQGLKDTSPDSPIAKALAAIGLSAAELRKMDPSDALQLTASTLQRYADTGDKARLVQDLFGKSIAQAAPFLKDLAEAGELNAKVTTEQAQEAERFNKELFRLETNISNTGRAIVSDLIPAMNDLFTKYDKGGLMAIFGFDEDYYAKKRLASFASDLVAAKKDLDNIQGDSLRKALTPEKDYAGAVRYMQNRFDSAKAAFKLAEDEFYRKSDAAGAGRGFLNPDTVKPQVVLPVEAKKAKTHTVKPQISELEKYLERLQEARVRVEDLSAVEQAQYDIATGKLGQLTLAEQAVVYVQARHVDQAKELVETQRDWNAALDEMAHRSEVARQAGQAFWAALETPAERYADQLARFKQLQTEGAFGDLADPQVAARVEEIGHRLKDLDPDMVKARESAEGFASTLKEGLRAALHDVRNFDDALSKLGARLLDRAFDSELDSLANGLMGMFSGGKSSGGSSGGIGLLPQLGSFFGFFADGGYLPPGRWGIAGENGPEPIYGGSTGLTVVPNGAGSGGAINVVQHITYNGSNRAELAATLELSRRQAMASIAEARRRGNPAYGG